MKKYILPFLLALLPLMATASPVWIDGIYYNLSTEAGVAEVTNSLGGSEDGEGSYSGDVVIPASFTHGGIDYSVTSIGDYAFYMCKGMTSITIPNTVTSMGKSAFHGCNGLKRVNISDCESWCKINFSGFTSNPLNFSQRLYIDGEEVVDLVIPGSVTSIPAYAFIGCANLASVTIGKGVTSIGEGAFLYCNSLKSVTIPASVTSIGEWAFLYCSSLTSVTSWITEPFEINEEIFYADENAFTSATLYVPKGTKKKYEATPAWNKFQNIEEIEVSEKMGDVNGDGAVDVADIATIIDVMAGKALQYKGKADVNGDHTVDVADIATVIDIMAGKDVSTGPDETIYTACPNDRHPHIIDLGLPSGTLWACCNVGAKAPEDYGSYYAWGETEPTEGNATLEKYAHSDGTLETCHDLGTDIAGTEYDAATANWKAPWRMPTLEQFEELKEKCASEWTTLNGKNGRKFTGPSGGTIFLPTSGILFEMGLGDENVSGGYWSANPNGTSKADYFYFNSDYMNHYPNSRYIGHSVRPVRQNSK